jgi:GntR family transcriptional regulator
LKNILLQKIAQGEFSAGSLIPSEREFSELLNISRMTVRQALTELVLEGVLNREKGKGTFISTPKLEQKNIMSFSETVISKGLVPSTKILHFIKDCAPGEIQDLLEIKPEEKVYILKRLRLANDVPVGIEENFIPERYCQNLESFDLSGSLYLLIKKEYGKEIIYVDHVISSSRPSSEEKGLLKIVGNSPVLKVTCINFAKNHVKLFYERSVYRSDEYKYSMRIYVNNPIE